MIGLDVGLAIGVIFSLLVIIVRTILPYSPSLGETRAWHYPPDEKLDDDEFDEEDLRVRERGWGGEGGRKGERDDIIYSFFRFIVSQRFMSTSSMLLCTLPMWAYSIPAYT